MADLRVSSGKKRFTSLRRFFQPAKMSQLQLSVLLLCVVVFTLGIGTSLVFTRMLERFVYDRTVEPLAREVRQAAQNHLSRAILSDWQSASSVAAFEQFAASLPWVLHINVYNARHVLIWSNDSRDVGLLTDDGSVAQALKGVAEYGRLQAKDNLYTSILPQGLVGQLTLPVSVEGGQLAVQMDIDLTPLQNALVVMRWYVGLVSVAAIAIMAAFLFIVFRKLGEQMMRQTQELAVMFDKSPVGIILLDASGRVESVNPAIKELWKESHNPPLTVGVGLPLDQNTELSELFYRSNSTEDSEGVIPFAQGEQTTWQYVRVVPLDGGVASSGRVMVLFEDITKQKELEFVLSERASSLEKGMQEHVNQLQIRAQELEQLNLESGKNKKALLNVLQDSRILKQRLQREHDQLQAVISSMGEGVYVLDHENRIMIMNGEAERILGVGLKSVKGVPAQEIYQVYRGNDLLKEDERPVRVSIDTATPVRVRLEDNIFLQLKDGRRFPITGIISPLGDDLIDGAVVVFREVTQEKQVDESKTNFISIASHQLRTPLTAIRWLSELLIKESKGLLPPQQESYVEDIHQSAGRMVTLVNALLNVSRIESGRVKIVAEKVQLFAIVNEVVKELSMAARGNRCDIKIIKTKKPLPKISADRDLIRQVVQNLLTNAIRYSRPNVCQIAVKLACNKTDLLLEVSDNGIGIPEEAKHKIFEKFYRAANASRSQTDGTGLGLYITKMVVDMAGGSIRFDSKENVGTTFYVNFPLKGMRAKKGEVGLIGAEK